MDTVLGSTQRRATQIEISTCACIAAFIHHEKHVDVRRAGREKAVVVVRSEKALRTLEKVRCSA